jgi:hypothetical protein
MRCVAVTAAMLLVGAHAGRFVSRTNGNVVAMRVAGAAGLSPVVLEEITPAGVVVNTVTLPTLMAGAFGQLGCLLPPVGVFSVSSSIESFGISRNERVLLLPCYNASAVGEVYSGNQGEYGR